MMIFIFLFLICCFILYKLRKSQQNSKYIRMWHQASVKNDPYLNSDYIKFRNEMWQHDPRNIFRQELWETKPLEIDFIKILDHLNGEQKIPTTPTAPPQTE